MIRVLFFIFFIVSFVLNIYFYNHREIFVVEKELDYCYIYPQNASSYDFPASLKEVFSPFSSFSIDGDEMVFYSLSVKKSISDDFFKKYGFYPNEKIVRNIQQLVFFFNDYQLRFRESDIISFFVRKKDNEVVYARLDSGLKKSVFEAFLMKYNGSEIYVNSEGYYISPCIKNTPFKEECAPMFFEKQGNQLIPVFVTKRFSPIRSPFSAKIVDIFQNKSSGGNIELYFSDYGIYGVFQNIAVFSEKIQKDKVISAGTVLGVSGFREKAGTENDLVVYYLRKKDGTTFSPFLFHHIEKPAISEEWKINSSIMVNFYRKWFFKAEEFEKTYYPGG